MTEKEYRTHPAISRSELWVINESPEKFKYFKEHPQPPTPALLFGQYLHKLILQPETLDNEFAVAPKVDRRTTAGRDAFLAFADTAFGKTVVDADTARIAAEMRDALMANPIAAPLLTGERERAFFWTDEDTGEDCKCRVDVITALEDGRVAVIDYKTTKSANPNVFNNEIYRYGYHFQGGMYTDGVMNALELSERPAFIFIAQEKTPPYAVDVVEVTPDVMTAGVDKFRELIGIYHNCKETGYWYGYNGPFGDINEAYLPGYMTLGDKEDDE